MKNEKALISVQVSYLMYILVETFFFITLAVMLCIKLKMC